MIYTSRVTPIDTIKTFYEDTFIKIETSSKLLRGRSGWFYLGTHRDVFGVINLKCGYIGFRGMRITLFIQCKSLSLYECDEIWTDVSTYLAGCKKKSKIFCSNIEKR